MRRLALMVLGVTACAAPAHPCLFPTGTFDADRCEWYSKQLRGLGEPPLARAGETYRFVWLRTFHHPLALRLAVDAGGGGTLMVKENDGKGGYEPGQPISDRMVHVDAAAVSDLRARLTSFHFWQQPAMYQAKPREPTELDTAGAAITIQMDGAEWILEAVKDGSYHVVKARSPSGDLYHDGGAFLGAATWFLEHAGLTIPADEMY